MLASTVQFSNNDQSHTLNTPKSASSEAGTETTVNRSLRTQQRARHSQSQRAFHAEAVLTSGLFLCRIVNVPPMSNRAGHSPATGIIAP